MKQLYFNDCVCGYNGSPTLLECFDSSKPGIKLWSYLCPNCERQSEMAGTKLAASHKYNNHKYIDFV